jgi:hypothetical protein
MPEIEELGEPTEYLLCTTRGPSGSALEEGRQDPKLRNDDRTVEE